MNKLRTFTVVIIAVVLSLTIVAAAGANGISNNHRVGPRIGISNNHPACPCFGISNNRPAR